MKTQKETLEIICKVNNFTTNETNVFIALVLPLLEEARKEWREEMKEKCINSVKYSEDYEIISSL